ncbi:thiamine pyrophosphate-dependent enzyme, partial [candidate division KSB1 bacterium]
SSLGVADGLSKAGIDERAVALFGDSSFFHTHIPALCNAVYNESDILIVVIDNLTTATSGMQPNPGVGRNAFGREAPRLSIEGIARACGVDNVQRIRHPENSAHARKVFTEELKRNRLSMVIVETECTPPD